MSTRTTRSKRFNKAIVEWLRTNSALVAFSGHTTNNLRIVVRSADMELVGDATPCVTLTMIPLGALSGGCDAGPFKTQVQIDCWGPDPLATSDACDAAYLHAEQVNGADASIRTNDIRTSSISALPALRMQDNADDDDSGVFVSTALLLITWYDDATS